MYYTSSGGSRFTAPQESKQQSAKQGGRPNKPQLQRGVSTTKEPASEKRQHLQTNTRSMFSNVSSSGQPRRHLILQQSKSAEGYLEPTISGVGGPQDYAARSPSGNIHVHSSPVSPDLRSPYSDGPPKGYFQHGAFLGVRSISISDPVPATTDDDDEQSQYSTHSSPAESHSHHSGGGRGGIERGKSPEAFFSNPQDSGHYNARYGDPAGYIKPNEGYARDGGSHTHLQGGGSKRIIAAKPPQVPPPPTSQSQSQYISAASGSGRPNIAPKPTDLSPDPLRRSPSSYHYPPPPPPIRTPPTVQIEHEQSNEAKERGRAQQGFDSNPHQNARENGARVEANSANRLSVNTRNALVRQTSQDENQAQAAKEANMPGQARVILLACGSFNPVTNMHLRLFELARDGLHNTGRFKVIGGIISPVSDKYKKEGLAAASHRCAMVRLALQTSDWIKLDTWECERGMWSPTVEVLGHHKELLDSTYNANLDGPSKRQKTDSTVSADNNFTNNINEAPVQIKLLCGADLFESFDVPNLWNPLHIEEIVGKFGIVCISRAGTNPEQFIYNSDILTHHKNNITLLTEWIKNEISATKIRRALRRGESVKYLVQDPVLDYIYSHHLYGTGDKSSNEITANSTHQENDTKNEKLQRKVRTKHKL